MTATIGAITHWTVTTVKATTGAAAMKAAAMRAATKGWIGDEHGGAGVGSASETPAIAAATAVGIASWQPMVGRRLLGRLELGR